MFLNHFKNSLIIYKEKIQRKLTGLMSVFKYYKDAAKLYV